MSAERIRAVRKALHMSQTVFAETLGTTRNVIGNYEYGRVEPKKPFMGLICSIHNVNPDWLLNGNGEMFAPSADEGIDEATEMYIRLIPQFRKYSLEQIKDLLRSQNGGK